MNTTLLVPDKTTKFTVFISILPPDLEVVHHNQTFPLKRVAT